MDIVIKQKVSSKSYGYPGCSSVSILVVVDGEFSLDRASKLPRKTLEALTKVSQLRS